MDKSWVRLNRTSNEYKTRLNNFLDTAFQSRSMTPKTHVYCPCRNCCNRYLQQRKDVYEHLVVDGMEPRYMTALWVIHGEAFSAGGNNQPCSNDPPPIENDMNDFLNEIIGDHEPSYTEGRTSDANRFYKLLEEADRELYPGCTKVKKLEFVVRLYQMKVVYGWSDTSFSVLLEAIKNILLEGETLPNSFYHTKKLIGELGLTYEKIDACRNDCMLYWKETAQNTSCTKCGTSRWKDPGKKISFKVFRYFPLTPRLQRLYMSSHTAEHMRWHDIGRTKDGVLRHPSDSAAWKNLDERFPNFGIETRNVRLGLASDGFNPFGNMSNAHSTWPVIISVYNLPPWMCMKQPYLLMSSLIPGPKGPGNDIDVYLQPLIHELKNLWEIGISTYDVSTNQTFTMRAALLWTINDFPAYATLLGWSTKRRYACPHCNIETSSKWLKHGRKFCYMGHRRFLTPRHRYRLLKAPFNGRKELELAPQTLSGTQCLEQLEGLRFTLGKGSTSQRPTGPWKKKSIFFDLPYWEHHLLRHNLDVMHIEKNVCDSVVGTLLNIKGKTKDGLNARADLKHWKIRRHLHTVIVGGHKRLPLASYTLTPPKKRTFCQVLSDVKVPDGYASNLSRCVNVASNMISGWKSHDCHVVMQQLLPLAMRKVLSRHVMNALNELSSFFAALCSKKATPEAFMELSSKIAICLCDLEKIFPPAFFDIMVHLPVHLAYEAAIAGPVQYRWMYPIERYLHTLKGYVRNKSRPEGCIAEGYLVEECLSFCSMYLQDIDSRRTRPSRNTNQSGLSVPEGLPIFAATGKSLGKGEHVLLDNNAWKIARCYVLFNCAEVKYFLDEHFKTLRRSHPRNTNLELERMQKDTFVFWFYEQVNSMYTSDPTSVTEDLRWLSIGPDKWVRRYKKYLVNGFRFRTEVVDAIGKCQNSGVFVTAQTSSYSSVRDRNPVQGNVDYYGVLTDVIELDYHGGRKVILFNCNWVDGRGVKKDEYKFTLVNLTRTLRTDDTYILASQALQVFYVQDPIDTDWHVAIKTCPRDYFDMNQVMN